MEELLLHRLQLLTNQILHQSSLSSRLSIHDDESRYDAEIVKVKLESSLKRFNEDLTNYFRMINNPSADEIGKMSEIQLEAEQNLAELDVKIKMFTTRNNTLNQVTTQASSTSSRLPKLNLPEFDGDVLNWHQFWDQFSSNIDARNITEVDKLLYLKASVRGEAKQVIDGFDTTNANYQIALRTLKERYGKTCHLVDAHYSALSRVKTADKTTNECRKVLNNVERHLRVLESLGEDINHNHLRHLIFEKFPEDLIYELKIKSTENSIQELRKLLEIIITAREDASRITQERNPKVAENYTVETLYVTQENRKHPTESKEDTNNDKETRSSKVKSSGEPRRKRMKLSCIFCNGSHFNDQCEKYKTSADRKAMIRNRCYQCFRSGHSIQNCRSQRQCFHCKERGKHNRALCPNQFPSQEKTSTLSATNNKGDTALQTAVTIASKDGDTFHQVKCRILFDSGSQRSYVTQKIARKLDLPIEEEENLSVFTFGAETPRELKSTVVRLDLQTRDMSKQSIYANVIPMICTGIPVASRELGNWKQKELLADNSSSDQIDILIGNDYYYSFMKTKKIQIRENLYLVDSKFGWVLSGIMNPETKEALTVTTYFQTEIDVKLTKPDLPMDQVNISSLWDLESIGITDSPKITKEEEAIRSFNETTEFIEGRYYVHWPWKEFPPNLTTNFGMTFGRLKSLIKRMNPESIQSYDETLQDQRQKGIIEIVPEFSETADEDRPVHYLPHHGVQQPGKPTRIVYDASSKVNGYKSLNECLYCGPMMLEDLTKLIIRFRSHQIGLSADVEKAFLQIGLHKEDRDVTRFLWLKDISKPVTEDNLLYMRFTRVPFGVISSPFLLNATIKHHLMKSKDFIIRKAANDIYVDNLVTGAQTVQEALILCKRSKETFHGISMNLREWSSNSEEFMHEISNTYQNQTIKLLGLEWHLKEDTLRLRFNNNKPNANTKRDILRIIASVYDPCGFATPSLLPGKLLLQELWKEKIKWDTPIPESFTSKWKEINNDLNEISEIVLPRRYTRSHIENCDLHCFTDSSTQAYAAVIYIVFKGEISFVIGKSRLVPIKDQEHLKIPRLELLGVLIGSRLMTYVVDSLKLEVRRQILWTDSQIVVDWVNSNKLLPPFVARRIEEIKRNKGMTIRYVPSELNPADVATRSVSTKEDRNKWLVGPQFLTQGSETWPSSEVKSMNLLSREGLPREPRVERDVNEKCQDTPEKNIDKPKERERNWQAQTSGLSNKLETIKQLQAEYFPQEYNDEETNLSRNLRLFKDVDGILRCKGRLMNADWSFEKRYPILIPKESEFTNNIIMKTHNENYHVGVNHTLSIIRQSYWIPQGKGQVQKLLRKCPNCMKHGGGPFKLPPTPALPLERVNYSSPFTFVGVDYMGPLLVKGENGETKRWICLYTCLAVRAIHLEVVQDLTAEEGLLSLRRMIATRGIPTLITSDNATHFKLMSEILSEQYCINKEIQWKFIPQLAPWFGGFYERLIGIVKNCMKRTLRKHMLTHSQLTTVTKEIEASVNMRPLTSVDSELEHVLKPADFLTMGRCITVESSPENFINEGTVTKTDLIKGWKKGLVILQEFQEMFLNRYLPSLRERYWHSHKEPRVTAKITPAVGQIVQLRGDSKNRETWKVGTIVSLQKGMDGLCRVANVKIGDKEFTRSIAHLYPLEIEDCESESIRVYNESIIGSKGLDIQDIQPVDVATEPIDVGKTSKTINDQREETNCVKEISVHSEESLEANGRIDDDKVDDKVDDDKIDEDKNNESKEKDQEVSKERRGAATRALQKIREWTQNLMTLF